ncbi:hypothetical protein ACFFGH_07410 [Lysobacter korlensis]|uniref:Uncharacterized protein n=1 Tax=Lysobacter korlensis TaxID=553636 RepID=A0ABV6RL12_9GAMM
MIANDPMPDLSDDDAVARLFDLATQGDPGSAELRRLDEVVYGRLLRTYAVGNDDATPRAVTIRG